MGKESKMKVLSAEALAGTGLEPMAPFSADMVIAGESRHESYRGFHGDIHVGVYQAAPAKLALSDYPTDELMFVLDGRVVVQEEGAGPVEFVAGQAFVLQRGFKGTFEMSGNFRKLAVARGTSSPAEVEWLSK